MTYIANPNACQWVFRQYLTDPDKYLDTQVSLFKIYQKLDQVNCANSNIQAMRRPLKDSHPSKY